MAITKQPKLTPQPIFVDIGSIVIPKKHRKVKLSAVHDLSKSIQQLGLIHLPAVWRNEDGDLILAAGRHRLEACKLLGLEKVHVHMVEKLVGRAWTSSENVHRTGLTKLGEADALMKYEKDIKILKGEQSDHPRGGLQPHDMGNTKLAEAAKISRKRVRQYRDWAAICDPAKKLLEANGLDNNASVLNLVAANPGLGQLSTAKEVIASGGKMLPLKSKSPDARRRGNPERLEKLKKRWHELRFLRPEFDKADIDTRKMFTAYILKSSR